MIGRSCTSWVVCCGKPPTNSTHFVYSSTVGQALPWNVTPNIRSERDNAFSLSATLQVNIVQPTLSLHENSHKSVTNRRYLPRWIYPKERIALKSPWRMIAAELLLLARPSPNLSPLGSRSAVPNPQIC